MAGLLGFLAGALLLAVTVAGQQIHRNGFETMKVGWFKGGFDAPYEEKAHAISDQVAHEGRHSEYLQLDVKAGTYIHYAYPTGKALVGEELSASLYLKANRPGMQLMARVVLPHERDPQNLDNLLTTYIRGDSYQQVGQWQHLQLGRPVQLAKQQQQLMQAQLKRAVDFTDAYVDGLLLNVYGGPGPTEVWIDDIEIGPMTAATTAVPAVRPSGPTEAQPTKTVIPRPEPKPGIVEFNGNKLKVAGRPFLFRGIHVTDTPLDKLREARFNTVFLNQATNPALIREAADRGLWVVPMLRVLGDDGKPLPPEELAKGLSHFAEAEKIFIHLGSTLPQEHAMLVKRAVEAVKAFDPGVVPGADVWDGLMPYSGALSLVGVHRWPLMTTLELPRYREWLEMRRKLARPSAFFWTSIQTHLPEPHARLLYDRPANATFEEPVGPQAEQVQLLAYTALAAGCRGLAFSSDRFLADSHQGRDRLLACALTNLELEMIEPMLVGCDEVEWVDTSVKEVKAAVLTAPPTTPLGILVLPIWQGPFSQFVPGQAAVRKLAITVPPVPPNMQAWEVTPGDVRHLKAERVPGGTKVTLPEFGLTSTIVFTANTDLLARFQEQAKGRRQLAAQWAHDMAAYELDKALIVHDQLVQMGHTLPDADNLIADARRRLQNSRKLWEARGFPEAYSEAQRALRPVRILMREQWEKAVRGMDSPVASPYAATYFTLPRHWAFMEEVKRGTVGPNVLPGGDFETIPERPEDAWHIEDPPSLDPVELVPQRVNVVLSPPEKPAPPLDLPRDKSGKPPEPPKYDPTPVKGPPKQGKQCARLEIKAKANSHTPLAMERTLLALTSPLVRLPAGTVVQISGWVCIPYAIAASPDGALFYDSAGGDALAVRLTEATPWKKFTVYRRVPASGTIQVTLALTGLGSVYFDDIRIEPILSPGAVPPPPVGGVVPASVR
jgi:hypothetical protein